MSDQNLDEERNDLLGDFDHLNSFIGLAKSFVEDLAIKQLLTDIQNDIFVIQANVANPENVVDIPANIAQDRIIALQKETHWIEKNLNRIDHFILPDGSTAACMMHCVRTTARQVERKLPGYLSSSTNVAAYLDRVACLMFALARSINQQDGYRECPPEYAHPKPLKKGGQDG